MEISGNTFQAPGSHENAAKHWHLRIPLTALGYVEFTRELKSPELSTIVGPFVDVIHCNLVGRLRHLREGGDARPASMLPSDPAAANGLAKSGSIG